MEHDGELILMTATNAKEEHVRDVILLLEEGRSQAEIRKILPYIDRRTIIAAEMMRSVAPYVLPPEAQAVMESALKAKIIIDGMREGASIEDRELALKAVGNKPAGVRVNITNNAAPAKPNPLDADVHAKVYNTIVEGGGSNGS